MLNFTNDPHCHTKSTNYKTICFWKKKINKENLRILEKHVKQDWAKKKLQTKLQQIIIKKRLNKNYTKE